jgi:hypothetical protein
MKSGLGNQTKHRAHKINETKKRQGSGLEVWTALLLFLMAVDLASWHGALVENGPSVTLVVR